MVIHHHTLYQSAPQAVKKKSAKSWDGCRRDIQPSHVGGISTVLRLVADQHCPQATLAMLTAGNASGPGRIRTYVGLRQRVYSPFPLSTRAPTHSFIARCSYLQIGHIKAKCPSAVNSQERIIQSKSRTQQRGRPFFPPALFFIQKNKFLKDFSGECGILVPLNLRQASVFAQ